MAGRSIATCGVRLRAAVTVVTVWFWVWLGEERRCGQEQWWIRVKAGEVDEVGYWLVLCPVTKNREEGALGFLLGLDEDEWLWKI